jgi:exonuclease SbcC
LLEIYQHKDTRRSDSPLTLFVKDLLGLDQLDALVEGLYAAGDIRRLRQAVPEYRQLEEMSRAIENELSHSRQQLEALDVEIASAKNRLRAVLGDLSPDLTNAVEDPDALQRIVATNVEADELQRIARNRRDLAALRAQWQALATEPGTVEQSAADVEDQQARSLLESWRRASGQALENIITQLAKFFPDLPLPGATDPEFARSAAAQAAGAELLRCVEVRSNNESDAKRISELDETLRRGDTRIAALDQQINSLAGAAEGMGRALAELLPHIHTDECPVCGRDYSEISPEPLVAHLSARITSLAERAGRLQALSKEKADAAGALSAARRERDALATRQLSPEALNDVKTRAAAIGEAALALNSLQRAATEGVGLIERASRSGRQLADLRGRDQRLIILVDALNGIADQLGQPRLAQTRAEPIGTALDRLDECVASREGALTKRQQAWQSTLSELRTLRIATSERQSRAEAIGKNEERIKRLQLAQSVADTRLQQARLLGRIARETRTTIVRRVFNESLNAMWKRLFVRLAPDEPFVPAFALPESAGGPVEAILETVHRSGGRAGNPQAVLSAGNLNTAALTLFLALHLSVRSNLPWLVIDDPVQSMDEVHIAQFAALLRTLSKQLGRQVVISVHERPLFEYLALELSPAFQDDRLITIELGRAADGSSTAVYEPKIWAPDIAIAA